MAGRRADTGGSEEGFLLEFLNLGGSVKVSALDPVTGREVSIVGPATAGEAELARTAVRKLRYILARGKAPGRA